MAHIVIISPRDSSPPLETTSFRIRMSLYGVIAVGSYLETQGHKVTIFCELSGSTVDWEVVGEADYVCFSFLSFCAARAYEMAGHVKEKFRIPIIMGGSHPSVMPEDALEHADFVVRNEGEEAISALIAALESGSDTTALPGISFRDSSGRAVHNPSHPFNADLSVPINMDLVPDFRSKGFLWSLKDAVANGMPRVAMPVIQASRGCPENCRFCVVKYQLGAGYRKRSIDVVLEEISSCLKVFRTPYFLFVDNDLSLDPDFATELFTQILRRHGRSMRPYVFCRIDVYKNEEFLKVFEQFDHAAIGVGVESIDNETLREMNKGQSAEEIMVALEQLRKYRISVNGLFIFGNENDTQDYIRRTVDFCIEQKFFSVGLFAIYDFPTRSSVLGQPQMVPDHLFIHRDWRFYNLNFAVNYPRLMRPSQLQQSIIDGYKKFSDKSSGSMVNFLPTRAAIKSYMEYLRKVEEPFYDSNDCRKDEKLMGRTIDDLARHVPLKVPSSVLYMETARFVAGNLFRGVTWKLLKGIVLPSKTSDKGSGTPWADTR